MTNYDAGRRFEWAIRDDLRANGYDVVRSAGSKSKIDLLAIKPQQVIFLQCKRNGLCPPTERTELRRLADLIHALPVVAYKARVGYGYRLLTGDGPRDWTEWTPDTKEQAA